MLLPLLMIAAVLGFVVYEKAKTPPSPAPGRCSPAAALIPGHVYKFGYALPPGTLVTPQIASQMALTMVSSGNFGQDTQAWVRGDVSAVAFGWPPDAPGSSTSGGGAVLIYGTYTGPGEVVPSLFLGAVDCGPSSQHPAPTTQTGYWGGVWGEDRMAGSVAASGQVMSVSSLPAGQEDPRGPSGPSDCNCITPDKVLEICVLILAQAMDGAAPQPQLQSMRPPPMQQMQPPMQMRPPMQMQPPAQVPGPSAQTSGASRAARMRKGQAYFTSYPAAAKLSSILWAPATVADAPASPTQMVADPTQNVNLPSQSIPQSAPRTWLSHFGPGRAIAVLTWIGPDNGADPGVHVWGVYSVGQAAAA